MDRFPGEYWAQACTIELKRASILILCETVRDIAYRLETSGQLNPGEREALADLANELDPIDHFKRSENIDDLIADATRFLNGQHYYEGNS